MGLVIAELVAWTLCLPLAALSVYLSLEITFGLRPLPPRQKSCAICNSIAVLIPAHNEVAGIGNTVTRLSGQMPQARLVVVADNCTDDTARVARACGADVFERHSPDQRGKGYALEFGRECLKGDPPDVVVIIDADCYLEDGSGELLAAVAVVTNGPVQAANLLVSEFDPTPLQLISNFAMLVKNLVRARGMMRIGGGIPLFGTGMAFPWQLFSSLPLATSASVEDLELGIRLARDGVRVQLVEEAKVTSAAASSQDNKAQRKRWEHGFLSQTISQALPLLFIGLARGSPHLITLGAHLLVPPIALFMIVSVLCIIALGMLSVFGASQFPVVITSALLFVVLLLLFVAWVTAGRATIPFRSLMLAPFYVLWKIPIYLSYAWKRQKDWNRTRRGNEPL